MLLSVVCGTELSYITDLEINRKGWQEKKKKLTKALIVATDQNQFQLEYPVVLINSDFSL